MEVFVRKLFLISLIFVSFISVQATENDNFYLCVNQWPVAKSLTDLKLIGNDVYFPQEQVINFKLSTKSKVVVPMTLYDRGSDVLVVAAQALPSPKESMEIFKEIFPAYDIVIFDYRWCNCYGTFLAKSIIAGKPFKKILLDETEELETVVNFALKRKKYSVVIGLGECYSCFHLARFQSDSIKKKGSGPFTHLILDSCWYSLRHFAERICYDPFLPAKPQEGGAPRIISWLTDNRLFKNIVLGSVFALMTDISIGPFISSVGIPVLFVHGLNDLFVPQNHFDKIWQSTNQEKRAVLLTPYRHSNNLGNKDLYRFIGESFISSKTIDEFIRKIQNLLN